MKTGIKIVQFRDGMWGAKKRGWFGWKYWHYYPGNHEFANSIGWAYVLPKINNKDRFSSKKLTVMTLSACYHLHRKYLEVK